MFGVRGIDGEVFRGPLEARGVGQAPVVNDGDVVIGLVSRANLLRVLNEEGGRVTDVRARHVADVMTTPVVTVDLVVDVRRIARAMLEVPPAGAAGGRRGDRDIARHRLAR